MNNDDLYERFEDYCARRGLTQKMVATMIGVSLNTIGNWKRTREIPINSRAKVEALVWQPNSMDSHDDMSINNIHHNNFFNSSALILDIIGRIMASDKICDTCKLESIRLIKGEQK